MIYTSPQVGSYWFSEVFYFILKWLIRSIEHLYKVLDYVAYPFVPKDIFDHIMDD